MCVRELAVVNQVDCLYRAHLYTLCIQAILTARLTLGAGGQPVQASSHNADDNEPSGVASNLSNNSMNNINIKEARLLYTSGQSSPENERVRQASLTSAHTS